MFANRVKKKKKEKDIRMKVHLCLKNIINLEFELMISTTNFPNFNTNFQIFL